MLFLLASSAFVAIAPNAPAITIYIIIPNTQKNQYHYYTTNIQAILNTANITASPLIVEYVINPAINTAQTNIFVKNYKNWT